MACSTSASRSQRDGLRSAVFSIPEPGPVVFVNEESGEAALWRRLDALCRGRAIDSEELRGRLFVAANRRVKLDGKEWQARIIEDGLRLRPRLFVFDPLARMKAAELNESAQNEISVAIEFMRLLRDETNAGVLFIHHTGHTGDHMRGSSDLETAWESRLRWKRDGQAAEVTIESEHREAEGAMPFKYRIAWDGMTRSMRFEAVDDPFVKFVAEYLAKDPTASGNAIYAAAEGRSDRPRKTAVHDLVKRLREGGSQAGNHPGTTPSDQRQVSGSPEGLSEAPGTTLTDAPLEVVPKPGTTPSWPVFARCPICDVEKPARLAAGVTYLACGHYFVQEVGRPRKQQELDRLEESFAEVREELDRTRP
jgi:AAA domain